MKKFKILNTPTRITDLSFDDDIEIYDDTGLRAEKMHIKQLRKFRQQLA